MPVLFPEPNGLGIDETLEFLSTSIRSKKITGMNIACYPPNLDPELKAAAMIVNMIASTFSLI
jgi:arginase